MFLNLFQLAGLAMPGWLLLIFFPKWSVTRRVAQSGFFPVYLAILYTIGVGSTLIDSGPGFMRDFGTAEGVARLLSQQHVAMIAWIHILAFDQVIGLWIYRENMRSRLIPLPVQSVLLFTTLMLGPIGFLAFQAIRVARRGVAAFEPIAPAAEPMPAGIELGGPAWERVGTLRGTLSLWREERALMRLSLAGIALGIGCAVTVLARGASIAPEGDLRKAATFDVAVGLYMLSILPWLPLAGFSDRGRRIWRRAMLGCLTYAFAIETIQQFRGIDPRFSRVEPISQIFGLLFFATALGITVAFVALAARFFNARAEGRSGLVVLGARYAALSSAIGFAAGFWITANQGRFVANHASILPLHAAGFHALQAVPLIALLFVWSAASTRTGARWLHTAGLAWALGCVALWWQTAHGFGVFDRSLAQAVMAACAVVWTVTLARALAAYLGSAAPVPHMASNT